MQWQINNAIQGFRARCLFSYHDRNRIFCRLLLITLFITSTSSTFALAEDSECRAENGSGNVELAPPKKTASALSPSELKTKLNAAENSYKAGEIERAIEQASAIVGAVDNSFLQSDEVSQAAKADLAVFKFKTGNPDQSAALLRELSMNLQLQLVADPEFHKNPAKLFSTAPKMMQEHFASLAERLGSDTETKKILASLVENTYPRDYNEKLEKYCGDLQKELDKLDSVRTIAEQEELSYIDPLDDFQDRESVETRTEELKNFNLQSCGETLNKLAVRARYLPVGDLRPSYAIYTLALLSNSMGLYEQAEQFAKQGLDHTRELGNTLPLARQLEVTIAYSLMRQDKTEEFKTFRDDLLKRLGDNERLVIALAKFSQVSGDIQGALDIYKSAMEARTAKQQSSAPDWKERYDQLLDRVHTN